MSFDFTIVDDVARPRNATLDDDIAGEDVYLEGGEMTETPYGDLQVVIGVPAARQSVIRELPANPGSFPRRPQWGGGLSAMVLNGNTKTNRDIMQSRARARLLVNPRLQKIDSVQVRQDADDEDNIVVDIAIDTIAGRLDGPIVVKPPGVR